MKEVVMGKSKKNDNSIKNLVEIRGKKVMADSLTIASYFKKPHKNVLRRTESTVLDDEEDRLTFEPIFYEDSYGREQEKYMMDRRSFSIVCMGFTGKDALKWKNRFYDAFEAMEQVLLQQYYQNNDSAWIAHREQGKMVRRDTTDMIQKFIEYAIRQGSTNADMYYMNITKMENSAMFLLEQKFKNLRDILNIDQLSLLRTAEGIIIKALKEGMQSKLHYKDIFQLAKKRVITLAELHGKTYIPAGQMKDGRVVQQLEMF
jgi:Rha family phage regulatory protein